MKTKSENPLPKIEALPGAVCAQWKRCGKPSCRCASGDLHGPYFYRFWRAGGRLRKTYVPRADVEQARQACLAWRQLQQLLLWNRRRTVQAYRQMRQMIRERERG